MSNEKIFNVSNKLKSYSVSIGEIELVQDVIVSLEISYKNNTPALKGKLLIDDLYDMHSQVDWTTVNINVAYTDLLDVTTEKNFRVTGVQEYEHSNYKKALEISMQDVFSYRFENSFLSKGFNSSVSSAISEYAEHFNLDNTLDFSEQTSRSFVVPKNVSNLEFFISELAGDGFYFYQDRDAVRIKSLSDLSVSSLPDTDGIFYDETDNKYYKNRIIASRVDVDKKERVIPKTRSLAYDFENKSILYNNNNDKTPFRLNDSEANIQDTSGYRDIYQNHTNFDEHTKMVRDSFLSQNKVEMVVSGFGKNVVNRIYDLKLRGNIITVETQTKGNYYVSGKYVCYEMVDKIVGDSFIQKIYLERADAQNTQ